MRTLSRAAQLLSESNDNVVTSIDAYIKQAFKDNDYSDEYGSLKNFVKLYSGDLVDEWLTQYAGQSLSEKEVHIIAKGLYSHLDAKITKIHQILGSFERQYKFKYPAIEGILTASYWKAAWDKHESEVNTFDEAQSSSLTTLVSQLVKLDMDEDDEDDSFNKKLSEIQGVLGQKYGDRAGLDFDEDDWNADNEKGRLMTTIKYIEQELQDLLL